MLIDNGVWKGFEPDDLQDGVLIIPRQVSKINLRLIHKTMFAQFGGGKQFGLWVDPKNPVYYSEGNCLIERGTGKVVFGTGNSKLPQDGSVHSIGTGAFAWCNFNDVKFEIPGSIKVVEDCAFFGSWGQGLCFMTGVCSIGDFALSATSINSIYLPETIARIGFCDLPDTIKVLTVDKNNPLFYTVRGMEPHLLRL